MVMSSIGTTNMVYHSPTIRESIADEQSLRGRRSVFYIGFLPILVIEVFQPRIVS